MTRGQQRFPLAFLAIILLSLCACGGSKSESNDEPTPATSAVSPSGAAIPGSAESAEAKAEPTAPAPTTISNGKPQIANLIANAALEPDEKTGMPKGLTCYPDKFFTVKTELNAEGGNAVCFAKTTTAPENFYHFSAQTTVLGGRSYAVGFEYKTSSDYSGEVAFELVFLPKGAGEPIFVSAPAPQTRISGDWNRIERIIATPQGANEIRLIFPRVRDFKMGTIRVRQPFVLERAN